MKSIIDTPEKSLLRKRYIIIALLFCFIGGALGLYATNLTIQLAKHEIVNGGICNFNEWISCDAVLSTKFATMFGIPVAWLGFLFYLWSILTLSTALLRKNRERSSASASAVLIGASAAVLFSVFKAVQLIILKVLCPVCVGMYIVNISLILLLVPAIGLSYRKTGRFILDYVKSLFGLSSGLGFSPRPVLYSIAAVWMFSLGYVGIKQYEQHIPEIKAAEKPFNMKEALEEHFKQEPVNVQIDSNAAEKGNPDAEVKIVEFADFQCPACKELADSMQVIWPAISRDVKFYFMNYPLDQSINHYMKSKLHEYSGIAACAGICAQEEGDFWDYYDSLFKNQKDINREYLLKLAEEHGWNVKEFSARMDAPEIIKRVKDDIEAGAAVELKGTPAMFVNGRYMKYWYKPEFIKAVIKQELERTKKNYALQ